MEWSDVGKVVAKSAPLLGTVLGGPAGGAVGGAVSMLMSAFGMNGDATPDEVLKTITTDPQMAFKLKELDNSHKLELQRLILQAEQMRLQDIQDARNVGKAMIEKTGKLDSNLYVLAYIFISGFFGSTGYLFYLMMSDKLPEDIPQGAVMLLGMLIGCLTSGVSAVLQYFFGSSQSSAVKTDVLASWKK